MVWNSETIEVSAAGEAPLQSLLKVIKVFSIFFIFSAPQAPFPTSRHEIFIARETTNFILDLNHFK